MLNMLEHEVLDELLETAIEGLRCETCNDFGITVTDNNRDQVIEMLDGMSTDRDYVDATINTVRTLKSGTKITLVDYMLLRAIKAKLAERMNSL